MVRIRQFRKLKSNVENDEILCKKWRNEMPLAFALHTWQLTVETSVKTIDFTFEN